MNLYYANGGGLGHLTRARAFLHQLGLERETAVLTASEFARDRRVGGDLRIIAIERDLARKKRDYQIFLQNVFAENRFEKVFLDSFPAGLVGEFSHFDFGKAELFYLARLLRWKNYAKFLKSGSPRFKKTFVLEELEKEHRDFVRKHSDEKIDLKLIYSDQTTPEDEKLVRRIIAEKSPFWLIVHAGEKRETLELLRFAGEMREVERAAVDLVVICPRTIPLENGFDLYPASRLFPFAERIFTACGFNAAEQTREFRGKHFFLPFERRYDDQFERARRLRTEAATALSLQTRP